MKRKKVPSNKVVMQRKVPKQNRSHYLYEEVRLRKSTSKKKREREQKKTFERRRERERKREKKNFYTTNYVTQNHTHNFYM